MKIISPKNITPKLLTETYHFVKDKKHKAKEAIQIRKKYAGPTVYRGGYPINEQNVRKHLSHSKIVAFYLELKSL